MRRRNKRRSARQPTPAHSRRAARRITTTWQSTLAQYATAFTAPSFRLFSQLLTAWLLCTGRRTVTGMLRRIEPPQRHAHDAYHRLLRTGAWEMARLWRLLVETLLAFFYPCPESVVPLDLDDTLFHKAGRRVNGAGTFRDAVRSSAKHVVYAWGLNLVVLTLRVQAPWGGEPLGLPINVRVYRKGGKSHAELAEDMIGELADWFPQRRFHLCADGAYACLAGRQLPRTHFTSRLRRDAALFEMAPPRRQGRRGRPRKKGRRLPTPEQLAARVRSAHWQRTVIDMRGHQVERLLYSQTVLWYHTCPDHLVRLVIVRDPEGKQHDDFFFTTDIDAQEQRGRDAVRRPLVHRGHLPQHQAVPRRRASPVLEGQGPRACRRALPVALLGRLAVLHRLRRRRYNLDSSPVVPDETNPVLHRRPRHSAPRTLEQHDFLQLRSPIALTEIPRPFHRRARLRNIALSLTPSGT